MHGPILDAVRAQPAYRAIREGLPRAGQVLDIANLPGSLPAALVATLARDLERRMWIVVAADPSEAEAVEADLSTLMEAGLSTLYPQREALPFEEEEHHVEVSGQRVEALEALLAGKVRVLVTTPARSRSRSGSPTPWPTSAHPRRGPGDPTGRRWRSASRPWASKPRDWWNRWVSTRRAAALSTSSASARRTRSGSSSGAMRSRPSVASMSWTSARPDPRARGHPPGGPEACRPWRHRPPLTARRHPA
jgi:hypothetical protein